MGMQLAQVCRIIDEFAPFRLAYEWDNVGLQVGDPAATVTGLMLMLEVDEAGLRATRDAGCQAILAHHPLIFQPMRSLRADNLAGALVMQLVRDGIGLIAAHTNLDRVKEGTNGALAAIIGLRNLKPLEPHSLNLNRKFVAFVPPDYAQKIIEAIHRGGGAHIGNYSRCTFRTPGTGTYTPNENANPFAGKAGNFEQADEVRIEAVVPQNCVKAVLHEVIQAHPYEEPACDIYPLEEGEARYGLGLVGRLQPMEQLGALAQRLARACASDVPMIVGNASDKVRRVAVVSGSPGNMLRGISSSLADVVVTGEVSYHLAAEARQRGQRLILLGHAASEKIFARHLAPLLLNHPEVVKSGMQVHVFEDFTDPYTTIKPTTTPRKRRKAS